MENSTPEENSDNPNIDRIIKRRNFIAYAIFTGLGLGAFESWKWLYSAPSETTGVTARARKPLRAALDRTELFFRKFFSDDHLVKTYPKSRAAKKVRVNSNIGMADKDFSVENWELSIYKASNDILKIGMNEIRKLPKSEIVFDFKCVEGWDQIQHWGGVRFIDFIEHYTLGNLTSFQYVGMKTPDGKYFVGLDMESAMHPQTILAYEMNGEPLLPEHGAPLRLIIPVKYGIKNLKRIGTIAFSDQRPPDYWAMRGYDYYSGL